MRHCGAGILVTDRFIGVAGVMRGKLSALVDSPVRIAARRVKALNVHIHARIGLLKSANSTSSPHPRSHYINQDRYIDDLVAENQRLRNQSVDPKPHHEADTLDAPIAPTGQAEAPSSLQGTLLEERPWFFDMNVLHTPVLIGEASDAAFATRFRQAISEPGHSHIPRVNYAPDETLLALSDEDCPWPIPSRARLLVNVALKYVSRCYYIVRRSQILEGLEQTIVNPHSTDSLLKSKLWVLFAIGEMYSTRTAAKDRNFPGMAYFARATRILRIISERPRIDAIEVRLLLVSQFRFIKRLI